MRGRIIARRAVIVGKARPRPMERRAHTPELLDGPLDDPGALRGNLRDLRRVNRLGGGAALSQLAIDTLAAGRQELAVIDVGTGAADIPLALLADARRRGRRLVVTAVDDRQEVLEAARALDPRLDRIRDLTLALSDGLGLAYPDDAFDIAHASLLLHHLEPEEARRLLRELARVARLGVVVNDLERGRLTLLGAVLASRLGTRNRYTRHDAPLSARRAYTRSEAIGLLREAGLRVRHVFGGPLGHRWAIAAVPA